MTWDGFSAYADAMHDVPWWLRLFATPIILLMIFLYMRLGCRPDEDHGPRGRTGEW